jgi:hypothetical protein
MAVVHRVHDEEQGVHTQARQQLDLLLHPRGGGARLLAVAPQQRPLRHVRPVADRNIRHGEGHYTTLRVHVAVAVKLEQLYQRVYAVHQARAVPRGQQDLLAVNFQFVAVRHGADEAVDAQAHPGAR